MRRFIYIEGDGTVFTVKEITANTITYTWEEADGIRQNRLPLSHGTYKEFNFATYYEQLV